MASLITHVSRKQMGYRFLETFQISVQTITMVLGYGATIGEKRHPRFSISFQNCELPRQAQGKRGGNPGRFSQQSRCTMQARCEPAIRGGKDE